MSDNHEEERADRPISPNVFPNVDLEAVHRQAQDACRSDQLITLFLILLDQINLKDEAGTEKALSQLSRQIDEDPDPQDLIFWLISESAMRVVRDATSVGALPLQYWQEQQLLRAIRSARTRDKLVALTWDQVPQDILESEGFLDPIDGLDDDWPGDE